MAAFFGAIFFSSEPRISPWRFFWIYGGLQILVDNILVGNNVESHQVEDEVFMEIDDFSWIWVFFKILRSGFSFYFDLFWEGPRLKTSFSFWGSRDHSRVSAILGKQLGNADPREWSRDQKFLVLLRFQLKVALWPGPLCLVPPSRNLFIFHQIQNSENSNTKFLSKRNSLSEQLMPATEFVKYLKNQDRITVQE